MQNEFQHELSCLCKEYPCQPITRLYLEQIYAISKRYSRFPLNFPIFPCHSEADSLPPLSTLPPNLPNPLPKSSNIIPLQQPPNSIPFLRQLFQARNPMHKTMTSPTQPRHIIQLILHMPSPLQHFRMHTPRYQMMTCKWNPCSLADLAFFNKRELLVGV
jgi:hypothetical protein